MATTRLSMRKVKEMLLRDLSAVFLTELVAGCCRRLKHFTIDENSTVFQKDLSIMVVALRLAIGKRKRWNWKMMKEGYIHD